MRHNFLGSRDYKFCKWPAVAREKVSSDLFVGINAKEITHTCPCKTFQCQSEASHALGINEWIAESFLLMLSGNPVLTWKVHHETFYVSLLNLLRINYFAQSPGCRGPRCCRRLCSRLASNPGSAGSEQVLLSKWDLKAVLITERLESWSRLKRMMCSQRMQSEIRDGQAVCRTLWENCGCSWCDGVDDGLASLSDEAHTQVLGCSSGS